SQPYDIIVSNDVLEHIQDDVQAVKKLAEMLVPQGTLCISVPAYPWLFGYHDEKLGHYRRYSRQDLLKTLTPHFQIKQCRYFAASLIPVVLAYSCWGRKPYPVGNLRKKSWLKSVLDQILTLEAKISLPVGISLIVLATKK
ncbi:MAG: methyltransferase domain-containing protein, partial [Spirulinaceae cyanobacterium]